MQLQLPIYFDYMATTPVDPRVAAKMQQYLTADGVFGNAASQHIYGYAAKDAIDESRAQVAALLNADPKEIIWTSGATEANNLAIKGAANFYNRQGRHIVTCETEHKAVLDVCKYLEQHGFEVTYLKPNVDGLLDLNKLKETFRRDTILVSIMHVNNEIGVVQNIVAIGELTRAHGILLHVDAAQSVGKIPIDVRAMKVDLMSLTAHKVYGPKGIGALYVRGEPKLHLEPQIHGGGQESGFRSGTLATHQIVGMGEALAIAGSNMKDEQARILSLRNRFLQGVQTLGGVWVNGSLDQRVAGNLNLSIENVDGGLLISALKDLAISTGSACNTLSFEPSYVLRALGLKGERLHNALRFSFGRFTTEAEIDFAIDCMRKAVSTLRK